MRDNFRDRDQSRSRSRERERRPPQKFSPRESQRHVVKFHVGNLPLTITEEDVQRQFQRFGRVEDVKIMRKNANGQPLREFLYGFIVMSNEDEGRKALEGINYNHELGWQVSYSKEKPRFDDGRRSPDRSYRPREHFRKESDEDKYHHYNRPRRERSPRREYDNRRREHSFSPEDRKTQERGPAQGTALMNLLNPSMNAANPQMAADLMKILQLPPDQLSQLTTSMEKNILNGNTILVRELWIGSLPENIQDKKLKNTFEMFGDVENIEYYNKPNTSFAFVKFRKVNQASKANEGSQSLKLLLESPNLKVTFSDHQRRKNVVGDHIDYEKDEDLTSIIYIGFNSGASIAPEGVIREVFSKYGEVLNVMVSQSSRDNSAKSYVLVEMGKLEQAKLARERIFLADEYREKRARLGDKNCELAILVKAKNNPNSQQNAMHGQGQPGMGRHQPYNQNQQYSQQRQPHQYQQHPNPQYNQQQPHHQQQYQRQPYSGQNPHQSSYNQGQRSYQGRDYGNQSKQGQYQNPQYQPPPTQNYPNQYQQQFPNQPPPNQYQQNQPPQNPNQPRTQPNPSYGYQPPAGYPDQRDKNPAPAGNPVNPYNLQGNQSATHGFNPNAPANPYNPQPGPVPNQPTGTSPINRFGSPVQFSGNMPIQGGFSPNAPPNRPPVSPNLGNRPVFNGGAVSDGSKVSPFNQNAPSQGRPSEVPPHHEGDKRDDQNKKVGHLQLLDTLQSIIAQTSTPGNQPAPQKQEEKKKIEEEHDDSNLDIFWSGFITKNKQNRVGVDALLVEGDDTILKDYFNLNISHRTLFEEVIKRQRKTLVIFRASGETHVSLFNDYLKYFGEKHRAGVVTLKKNTLYILPPCEEVFKIHKFNQNELLGVFSDLSDIPKESLS